MKEFDFSGWATRNNIKCSDGRTIMKNAFKHNDGQIVPLVWNHQHNEPTNVLGHALLENHDEGVYAYCKFNSTPAGLHAKEMVLNGDIKHLSIYANKLKQQGSNVLHGAIREVSLVLAGANPGAFIDSIMAHGEEIENAEEAIIFTDEDIALFHAEEQEEKSENKKENEKMADNKDATVNKDKTVKEVFDSLTEEQKTMLYVMIGQATEDAKNKKGEEDKDMKHNVFENDNVTEGALSHADMEAILKDAKRTGSLKEAYIAHAENTGTEYAEKTQSYGINGTDWLFPEARTLNNVPEFIKRDTDWVQKVMSAVHHTPFSRIKSVFANITEDEARAKGYMKGKAKKDEVFSLLKRSTTPTTIYKKQKMDRDDVVDITDFDVVAWIKQEMRAMLDEEIARAVLIGDGRLSSSDDKINELNIRPIWKDEDLYTVKQLVEVADGATADAKTKAFIRAAVKARKNYKGSGQPTLYTTEDVLTDCLLLEDNNGRVIYDSEAKLATALRVKEIVVVPVMENATRTAEDGERSIMGLIVNLKDYNVGADKGGAVNMFDDFDIDYNAQKYLIETRCSGALTKPYSAIALEIKG